MGKESTPVRLSLDAVQRVLCDQTLAGPPSDAVRATLKAMSGAAFCVFDSDLRFVFAEGQALAALGGRPPGEIEGALFDELLASPPHGLREAYEAALAGRSTEVDIVCGSNTWEVHAAPVHDANGAVVAGLSITLDVTEERYLQLRMLRRARGQAALTALSRLAAEDVDVVGLLHQACDAIAHTLDIDRVGVQQIDESSGHLLLTAGFGWPSDVIGRTRLPLTLERRESLRSLSAAPELLHDVSTSAPGGPLLAAAGSASMLSVLIGGAERAYGTLHAASVSPREFNDQEAGFLQSIANILWNAIERSDTAATYRTAELYDQTTGLASRSLMLERLERAIDRAGAQRCAAMVLLVDLDNFNVINDSIGRLAGDELLRALAPRLQAVARSCDTVARLGGDEFAIVCEGIVSEAHALSIAERVAAAVREPFDLDGRRHVVQASVGVVVDAGGSSPDLMVRDADAALHAAKTLGGGRVELFSPAIRQRVVARMKTESELYRALERDEMRLHYQPFFSVPDRRLLGMEALVRWQHPDRGLVPPDEFIPLAEQTGLIVDLGAWVLRTAARTLNELLSMRPTAEPLTVSVNVSALQLRPKGGQTGLIETVQRTLADTRLPASVLALEITESTIMDGDELPVLLELKELGVQTMLDDFGTGHSSLSRLSDVPLDVVKIDRRFVSGLGNQQNREPIVAAIIAMADALGLRAIAEGVETDGEWDSLVALGCTAAQGFGLARPMPANELMSMVGDLSRQAA